MESASAKKNGRRTLYVLSVHCSASCVQLVVELHYVAASFWLDASMLEGLRSKAWSCSTLEEGFRFMAANPVKEEAQETEELQRELEAVFIVLADALACAVSTLV